MNLGARGRCSSLRSGERHLLRSRRLLPRRPHGLLLRRRRPRNLLLPRRPHGLLLLRRRPRNLLLPRRPHSLLRLLLQKLLLRLQKRLLRLRFEQRPLRRRQVGARERRSVDPAGAKLLPDHA